MFPGDSFSLILFLLLLQHQLDEELLQLLVTVVDAELFKAATQTEESECFGFIYCEIFYTKTQVF